MVAVALRTCSDIWHLLFNYW